MSIGVDETDVATAGELAEGRQDAEVPRRLSREARMPQILEAALAEFAERGYGGARMAAVASRVGIAKGLIYHYFPSKTHLFQAAIRACAGPVLADAERRVAEMTGSAWELLRTLLEIGYAQVGEEGRKRHLVRLVIAEAEHFPELSRLYEEEILRPAIAIARSVLRAGAASGEFRAEIAEAEGLAEVMMAPTMMCSVWRMMLGEASAPAPEAMLAVHLDLLRRSLTKTAAGA